MARNPPTELDPGGPLFWLVLAVAFAGFFVVLMLAE